MEIKTIEELKKVIGTSKTEKTICNKLDKLHINYINNSEEMNTLSIKIYLTDGSMLRVYKNTRKELVYQTWNKVTAKKVIKEIPTCYGHTEIVETYQFV